MILNRLHSIFDELVNMHFESEQKLHNKTIVCKNGCSVCCESVKLVIYPNELSTMLKAMNKYDRSFHNHIIL